MCNARAKRQQTGAIQLDVEFTSVLFLSGRMRLSCRPLYHWQILYEADKAQKRLGNDGEKRFWTQILER